jgi:hypothetical protein
LTLFQQKGSAKVSRTFKKNGRIFDTFASLKHCLLKNLNVTPRTGGGTVVILALFSETNKKQSRNFSL